MAGSSEQFVCMCRIHRHRQLLARRILQQKLQFLTMLGADFDYCRAIAMRMASSGETR